MNVPLIARGATPIELDRKRLLLYDVTASWLLYKRYGWNFVTALFRSVDSSLELVSEEALVFYLYVGLLAEARSTGEALTEEYVRSLIVPFNIREVFLAVATAVAAHHRAAPFEQNAGKDGAAPAGPVEVAAVRPARVSTSTKRSASRTASSAKARRSSSRKR